MLTLWNRSMVMHKRISYCSKLIVKKVSKYPNILTEIYMDMLLKELRIDLNALKKDIDASLKDVDLFDKSTNKIYKDLRIDLESIKKDIDAFDKSTNKIYE